jgi:hypothetical protein
MKAAQAELYASPPKRERPAVELAREVKCLHVNP